MMMLLMMMMTMMWLHCKESPAEMQDFSQPGQRANK